MSDTLTVQEIEALEAYRMPKPSRGQSVLWFPHANPQEVPEVAYVRQVGTRGLIITVSGVQYEAVRHVTDPKLKLNEHQRAGGAWDFPETDRDAAQIKTDIGTLKQRVEQLEAKLKTLEDLVCEPKKGK